MIAGAIPKRYARALLTYSRDHALGTEALAGELAAFSSLLNPGTRLRALMANRLIPARRKSGVLEEVMGKSALSPLLANFIRLLHRRDRLLLLPEISLAFQGLADEHEGILRAEVLAAAPPTEKILVSLKEKLAASMSKKVILTVRTDPEIIGGLVVRVGSLSLDGSIRAQMGSIRKKLSERVNP